MRRIRVGWDYFVFPVWEQFDDEGWVETEDVPMSATLRADLVTWADEQTELRNLDRADGIPNGVLEQRTRRRDDRVTRLREELGDEFDVSPD